MVDLIELKCKSCGGLLSFDESGALTCPYCGTTHILSETEHIVSHVEKAIKDAEFVMQSFGEYDDAYSRFLAITKDDPSNYRGYLGALKAMTKCFTDVEVTDLERFNLFVNKLYKTAPDEQLKLYKEIIEPFTKKVHRFRELKGLIGFAEEKFEMAKNKYQLALENMPEIDNKPKKYKTKLFFSVSCFIIILICLIIFYILYGSVSCIIPIAFALLFLFLGIQLLKSADNEIRSIKDLHKKQEEAQTELKKAQTELKKAESEMNEIYKEIDMLKRSN